MATTTLTPALALTGTPIKTPDVVDNPNVGQEPLKMIIDTAIPTGVNADDASTNGVDEEPSLPATFQNGDANANANVTVDTTELANGEFSPKNDSKSEPNFATHITVSFMQRTLAYFVRGSITVWLTSCLTGLDLAKQVNLLLIKHKQSS